MSGAEGIGEIFTGGIVAREVDRAGDGGAGGHGDHDGAGGECLNCGTTRIADFCHNCGQSGHVHRNVAALGHDILHGVFHFEGKIWKTLPMLFLHPGDLTRRYVHGQRARFVSPMALFLFSVFLLFAAVNRLSMPDVAGAAQGLAKAQSQISDEADKAADKVSDLEEKRGDLISDDPKTDTSAIDKQIAGAKNEVAALKIAAANLPKNGQEALKAGSVKAGNDTYNFTLADSVKSIPVNTGSSSFNRHLQNIKDNPQLYAYKLKMASYKISWALIPISVPFIWLLFCFRRDVGFYDHAIFAIYSLSFMTLLVVALLVLYMIGIPQGLLWLAFLIAPPIHMYKQLKGAYRLGRFGAFWRTWTLLFMTAITSSLFFSLLLWLEAD